SCCGGGRRGGGAVEAMGRAGVAVGAACADGLGGAGAWRVALRGAEPEGPGAAGLGVGEDSPGSTRLTRQPHAEPRSPRAASQAAMPSVVCAARLWAGTGLHIEESAASRERLAANYVTLLVRQVPQESAAPSATAVWMVSSY